MWIGALPTGSTRGRYEESIRVTDKDTGEPIDLTGYTIILSIRNRRSWTGILTATIGDGIEITDAADGVFTLTFTPTQMRTLCAKEYDVGCTIAPDDEVDETMQIIIGSLSMLDGVVN